MNERKNKFNKNIKPNDQLKKKREVENEIIYRKSKNNLKSNENIKIGKIKEINIKEKNKNNQREDCDKSSIRQIDIEHIEKNNIKNKKEEKEMNVKIEKMKLKEPKKKKDKNIKENLNVIKIKNRNKINKKETDYEDTIGSDFYNCSAKSTNTENNVFINEEIDESDDEYNINTLGNFDLKHYENFDIIGYDIKGRKIYKEEGNAIDDFIESKTDDNAWRKIKDKKNNRIVQLTNTDLEIIKSIRENKVAKYIDNSNYIYENEKEEYKMFPTSNYNLIKANYKESKHDKKKILQIMNYLLNKQKYPERYLPKEEDDIYDLWKNKIYDEFNNINEINLPNILPGHKYSYNPPPELMYNSSEKRNILKNNEDAFIPQKFKNIRSIEYYKKTYFDLYQRCLDIYLCSRSLKNVLNINKEDLLPKLPSTNSLKPFPQYQFIKYILNDDLTKDKNKYNGHIDINERDHIVYTIQCNTLYVFDILTSYNMATIDLKYYYKKVIPKNKISDEFQDNVMIKVNKAYSILAISCGNIIFLFHYESYVPPIRSGNENVEEIYHTNKKNKSTCNDNDNQNKEKNNTSIPSSNSGDEDESDLYDEDFDEENDDDDETYIDNSNMEIDEDENEINSNTEENCESKKQYINLDRNIIYHKTKGLLSVFHNNFKNTDEYCYSTDVDIKWINIKSNDKKIKYCVAIKHEGKIKDFSWNKNGNYLSVTCLRKVGQYNYCYLHHLKSMKSIKLIKKYKQKRGDIIQTMFFPRSPYFAVAFENNIIIYNLKPKSKKDRIIKKLRGIQNITSIDIHISEGYVLASDERGKVFIFDLELSSNPYKKFHLQDYPLKKVEFHKIYNLFYSLSSNGTVNLFYSKFFQDYITNPILLPIKQLSYESKILDLVWSHKKPWLFVHTDNNFSALYT
ncbi:large subunit rRNA processing protein, putative [Plasmodium gallinaceum]|uniref:Ribosome biogenesis protein BOP1 homolog n=1 Tax=Plasmodium gallinaceum TaxID=5849 RepID=A0A1J1GTL7_PLAGA|nr:large subunit rRNA processing protein, putative [Plasmodium gallinaceum]CRG95579.1 large subunit rRNA processing protein, putative [Plasmodium gallinaceum]